MDMEAHELKRILLYVAAAFVLGVAITLVPLITQAEIENTQIWSAQSLSQVLRDLDGSSSNVSLPKFSASDLEILTSCFVVALVIYLWVRSKGPDREYRWLGYVPY
jgi:hypothetical protein